MENGKQKVTRRKGRAVAIAVVVTIILVLTVGIVIYNTPEKRLARQLDLGNRYLEEQNYEQAIVAFDLAISIDPKSAEAYLGKAEANVGMGNYEQAVEVYKTALQMIPDADSVIRAAEQFYLDYAQIYIDSGDLERAIGILEEGVELLNSERIREKLEEVRSEPPKEETDQLQVEETEKEQQLVGNMIEFPFELEDITFCGFDLLDNHYEEIAPGLLSQPGYHKDIWTSEFGSTISESVDLPNGNLVLCSTSMDSEGEIFSKSIRVDSKGSTGYVVYENDFLAYEIGFELIPWYSDEIEGLDDVLQVPLEPGASYKEWCDVLRITEIKRENIRPELNGEYYSLSEPYSRFDVYNEGQEIWLFNSGKYSGYYEELSNQEGKMVCRLSFYIPERERGPIYHINSLWDSVNAVAQDMQYGFLNPLTLPSE